MHSDIIITAAVYEELSALIDRVEKPVVSKVGKRKIISGHIEGKSVKLLITGPGLVNTVQALTAAIENSMPSLIIQTGCAGAFKESGLKIGDIGIATEEIGADLGIEPENGKGPLNELPFPLLNSHGTEIKNRYHLDHELANLAFNAIQNDEFVKSRKIPFSVIPAKAGIQSFQAVADDLPAIALAQKRLLPQVKTSAQARRAGLDSGFHRSDDFLRIHQNGLADKNIGLMKGPFITVSTITATDMRAEKLYKQFKPCMESMEGSGAAHLAIHYNIPFLEIRSASNMVGKRDPGAWDLALAFERGAMAVFAFIRDFDQTCFNHYKIHLKKP
jgi:nucleoside phosphorylase